jgi:MFS family permease
MHDRTRRGEVAAVIAAGVVTAFAIGKAPIALPALQREFGLSAIVESLIISLLALIGAGTGIVLGTFADRAGHRRLVLAGLTLLGAASIAGAFANGPGMLLATRFVEGLGFVMTVVSAPPLIVSAASARTRRLALALWSTYVPGGTALVMLLAPIALRHGGWRVLWIAVGFATWIAALGVAAASAPVVRRRDNDGASADARADVAAVLRAPLPVALAVGFAGYAAAYLALVGFLPTMLVGAGATTAAAGIVSALIVLANGTGNVAAGFIARRRGAAPLIAGAASVMGAGACAAFVPALPIGMRLACALVGALAGGIVPACIMLSVPEASPSPRLMATTQGLIVQGSSAGQVLGPVLVAAAGGLTGGPLAAALVLGLSVVPLVAARALVRGAP